MPPAGGPKYVPAGGPRYMWYRDLNRYQWFVVAVAAVGWMFDTMAQQLFNLARVPAIRELMGGHAAPGAVADQAGYATSIFIHSRHLAKGSRACIPHSWSLCRRNGRRGSI